MLDTLFPHAVSVHFFVLIILQEVCRRFAYKVIVECFLEDLSDLLVIARLFEHLTQRRADTQTQQRAKQAARYQAPQPRKARGD